MNAHQRRRTEFLTSILTSFLSGCDQSPTPAAETAAFSDSARADEDGAAPAIEELFAGYHHARFHDPDTVYHVISKAFQGRMLLKPTPELNSIIAGVVGYALKFYSGIKLYGITVLSNHLHMMLQGPPDQVPRFIAFVKREISERWGKKIDWPGSMWEPYLSTALPTHEDQERCLKYLMSQGVKEGLIASPEHWSGVHAAKNLAFGEALEGIWVDGTRLGKALYKQRQKLKENPQAKIKPLNMARYQKKYTVELAPLPGWSDLSSNERQAQARQMVDEIVQEARTARNGKPVLGMKKFLATHVATRGSMPKQPWFEERGPRMIFWGNPRSCAAKEYTKRYWEYQQDYRRAAHRYRLRQEQVDFPEGSFQASRFVGEPSLACWRTRDRTRTAA